MLRIAAVDDEAQDRDLIERMTARFFSEHSFEAECTTYDSGVAFLDHFRGDVDLVLLDVRMPALDGFETARRLRDQDEQVALVFITSMAQYAIRGYEVHALDFIVKPVNYEEFSIKMERVLRYLRRHPVETIPVTTREGLRMLSVRDITFIEVFNHDLVFHTVDGPVQTHGQLSDYETDPRFTGFCRSSQSHLVNCAHVRTIEKDALIVAGEPVPLSRRRRKDCLSQITKVVGTG